MSVFSCGFETSVTYWNAKITSQSIYTPPSKCETFLCSTDHAHVFNILDIRPCGLMTCVAFCRHRMLWWASDFTLLLAGAEILALNLINRPNNDQSYLVTIATLPRISKGKRTTAHKHQACLHTHWKAKIKVWWFASTAILCSTIPVCSEESCRHVWDVEIESIIFKISIDFCAWAEPMSRHFKISDMGNGMGAWRVCAC